jgi:hypothetical protein
MQLGRNEACPIHQGKRNCCGRARLAPIQKRKYISVEPGVRQVRDETVTRGYRELRSKAAMKRLLVQKVKIQHGLCFYCHKEFETFEDVTPDHREPKGMGGGRRDDHTDTSASKLGV